MMATETLARPGEDQHFDKEMGEEEEEVSD